MLASNSGHPQAQGYYSGSRLNKVQAHKNYSLKWLQRFSTQCLTHCFGGLVFDPAIDQAYFPHSCQDLQWWVQTSSKYTKLTMRIPNTLSSGRKNRTLVETRGVYLGVIRKSTFRFLSLLAETAKDLKSITLGLGFVSNNNNRCAPLNPPSKSSVL